MNEVTQAIRAIDPSLGDPVRFDVDNSRSGVVSGVYALMLRGAVVYVGQSIDIRKRLGQHHIDRSQYDQALMVPVPRSRLNGVEGALILALDPPLNRAMPAPAAVARRLAEPRPDAALFVECGQACYGSRWQTMVARRLDVTDRTVRRWAAGTHPIPPEVRAGMRRLAIERAERLDDLADRLRAA